MDTNRDRLPVKRVLSEPAIEVPVNRSETRQMIKNELAPLTIKLDARAAQNTQEFVFEINENRDDDHSMALVRGAFRTATR